MKNNVEILVFQSKCVKHCQSNIVNQTLSIKHCQSNIIRVYTKEY